MTIRVCPCSKCMSGVEMLKSGITSVKDTSYIPGVANTSTAVDQSTANVLKVTRETEVKQFAVT